MSEDSNEQRLSDAEFEELKAKFESPQSEPATSPVTGGPRMSDEEFEALDARVKEEEYGGLGGMALTALAGVGKTLSFGGTDYLAGAAGFGDELAAMRKVNPGTSITSDVGSLLLPLGPLSAGVRAVTKAATGVGARLAAKGASKAVQTGAALGTEGLAYGAGQAISDAGIGDHDLISSKTIATIGLSGLTGGALGALIGKMSSRIEKTPTMADDILDDIKFEDRPITMSMDPVKVDVKGQGRASLNFETKPLEVTSKTTTDLDKLAKDEVRARQMATDNLLGEADKALLDKVPAGEKVGFMKDFLQRKSNADEIVAMNERLGVETLPVQLAANKRVQELYDRAMRRPDYFGTKLFTKVSDISRQVKDKMASVFQKYDYMSDEAIGRTFKEKIDESVDNMLRPVSQYFDALDDAAKGVRIPENDLIKFHGKLAADIPSLEGAVGGTAETMYSKYMELVLRQPSIANLKGLARQAGADFAKFADPRSGAYDTEAAIAANKIKQSIDEFVGDMIVSNAKKEARMATRAVKKGATGGLDAKLAAAEKLSRARMIAKSHREYKGKYAEIKRAMSEFAKYARLKKGDVTKGQLEALLSGVADEKIVGKVLDLKNAKGLEALEKSFPEAFEVLRQGARAQMLRRMYKNGDTLSINAMRKAVFDEDIMSKGVREKLFTKEELQLLKDGIDWDASMADMVNASRTSDAQLIDSFIDSLGTRAPSESFTRSLAEGVVGEGVADIGFSLLPNIGPLNAVFSNVEGALTDIIRRNLDDKLLKATKTQLALKKAEKTTTQKIFKGIKTILNNTTPRSVTAKSISMIVSQKDYEDKSDEVRQFADDPQFAIKKLGEMTASIEDDAPGVAESIKMQTIQAMNFLASKLPSTEVTDNVFFERRVDPSQNEINRFNRYYSIVENPTNVLTAIESGTLTSEHIETIQTVYPKLYDDMQKMFMGEIAAKKNKSSVPYRTRMMISLFMGQSFDSSLKTQSLMTYQGHFGVANMEHEQQASLPGMREMTLASRTGLNSGEDDA